MARTRPIPLTRARGMRRESTDAEKRLWSALRGRRLSQYKFRRQHPVGRFIVDFACIEAKLIVELDGGQHASQARRDEKRTRELEASGYRVLRFWNNDALANAEGVLTVILRRLQGGAE
ncbi:MAG: endonuclease domain-containing protein [Rhodospirillales bacterium]